MKGKILNFLLVITSMFGYLEWGKDNHSFLFQTEAEIASKLFSDPGSALHPFVVLPLIGQLLLFVTLFQSKPSKRLTFIGMAGLALLLVFIFAIGLMSFNLKMALSALPFIVVAVLTIKHHKRRKPLAI